MTINVDAKSQDIPSLLDKGQRQMAKDNAEGIEFEELIAKDEQRATDSEEELAEVEELDDHADWVPVDALMASSMLTSPHNMKLRLTLEEKGGALTAESDDLSEVASDTHPQQLRADTPHALGAESQRFNLNKQLMEELQKEGFEATDEMPTDMDAAAQQALMDAKLKAALEDTSELQPRMSQAVQTETPETIDLAETDESGIDTVTSMDSRTAVNAETSGDSSRFSENSAEQESSEHETEMTLSEGEGGHTDSARPTSEMSQSHSQQPINTNALDTLSIVRENGTINQVSQVVFNTQQSLETGETKTLTLSLNPSELGQVNIELQSTGESTLIAKLQFERPETLAAFQNDVSQLKDILNELGIQDTQLDLQLSMDQGKQQFSGGQHPEYTSWEEREALLARDSTTSPAESESTHPTLTRSGYAQKRNTHLDVRA